MTPSRPGRGSFAPFQPTPLHRYDVFWGEHEAARIHNAALGVTVAVPLTARAQQRKRLPRVGALLAAMPDDSEYPSLFVAFLQGLQQLGWTDRRNVRIETRWAGGGGDTMRRHTAELVALAPDVIMAAGASAAGPVLQATRTIPIVFTITPDPVGAGFVEALAKPGGNATGFTSFEYGIGGKWLELLKELAPRVTRVAVARDRPPRLALDSGAPSRQLPPRSECKPLRSTCVTSATLNALWLNLRAFRTAV